MNLNVKGNTPKLPPKNPAKVYNPPPLNKPTPILNRGGTSTIAHQVLHDPARLMERENGRRMSDSGSVAPYMQPLAQKRAARDSSYHEASNKFHPSAKKLQTRKYGGERTKTAA